MTKAKKRCEILSTKDVPKAGKRANEYAENNFEYKLVAKSSEENSYFFSQNRCLQKRHFTPVLDRHQFLNTVTSSPPANPPHARNHHASSKIDF